MSSIAQTVKRWFGRGDRTVEDSLSRAGLTVTQTRTFSERMQEADEIVRRIKLAKERADPVGLIEAYNDLVMRIGIPFHRAKDSPNLARGIGAWNDQVVRAYWMCHWLPYSEWSAEMKASAAGWEAEIAKEEEEKLRKLAEEDPVTARAIRQEMQTQKFTLVAAVIKLLEADAWFIAETSFAGKDMPQGQSIVIHGVPPGYGGGGAIIPTGDLAGSKAKPPDGPVPGKIPRDQS